MCVKIRNVNTASVANISWAFELGHNLLIIIPLAKKDIEVFLRNKSCPLNFHFEEKVFGFVIIVYRQYIVRQAFSTRSD